MLEGVHHGHVGPEEDGRFQVLDARAGGVRLGVEAALAGWQVGRREQFHRHGGHLGELHAHVELLVVGQRAVSKTWKACPPSCSRVCTSSWRPTAVHEDERQVHHVEVGAVAAGRLALAVVQVEQLLAAHHLEVFAQLRVDLWKMAAHLASSSATSCERDAARAGPAGRRPGPRGAALSSPRRCSPPLVDALGGGHDDLFDRLVEGAAVVGGVIEAVVHASRHKRG